MRCGDRQALDAHACVRNAMKIRGNGTGNDSLRAAPGVIRRIARNCLPVRRLRILSEVDGELPVLLLSPTIGVTMSLNRVSALLVALAAAACSRTSQSGAKSPDGRTEAGITQLAEAPAVRRVWSGLAVDFEGRPSPDGRFISTTDWNTGDLGLRDLAADSTRHLTKKGSWSENPDFAEGSVISPDGKTVVFGWFSMKGPRFELRASPITGPDSGKVRTIFSSPDVEFPSVQSFTPDGRHVAAVVYRKDRTTQIALIPLDGGPARILKSFDWRSPNDLSVSPDGRWLAYDFPRDQSDPERDVYVVALDGSRETAVLRDKGNDVVTGWTRDGSHLLVGSARSGTPGIWALAMDDGRTHGEPVLVRADIWRMVPIGTSGDGSIFYGIQTGERDLFSAAFDSKTGKVLSKPASLSGGAFNASPYTLAFSPDGQHVAYIVTRGSASNPYSQSDLVIRSLGGNEVRRLTPDLSRISRVNWLPDGRSLLVRGSNQKGRGGLYRVALESGAVTPVYQQGSGGLSQGFAITRDGSRVYFATTDSSFRATSIVAVDLPGGTIRPIHTAAPGQQFGGIALSPDDRYIALALKAQAAGSSTIQIVSVDGGTVRELHRIPAPDDIAQYATLLWHGDFVYFGARSSQPVGTDPKVEMRRVAVADGHVEPVALESGFVTAFQISRDGRRIAYGVSNFGAEMWVMSPPKLSAGSRAAGEGR